MEGIKIIKSPKLKNPYFIAAWPGMGDVAFKAALHLIKVLKAEEFAELSSEDFFYLTGSAINSGLLEAPELPRGKFYYWKNPASRKNVKGQKNFDLVIFVSNAQPDLSKAEIYSRRIATFLKSLKVKTAVSFAAMPQPIEHTQPSSVWFAATSKELALKLKNHNIKMLPQGQISGMNGLFLGIARELGLEGICLLGDIPLYTIQIENPKATKAVLQALGKFLNFQFDLRELDEQITFMESEINKLMDYLRLDSSESPIGEEEIEKIKKTLSQLTKLPLSIKDRIEKLFEEAKTDIGKANELKAELDKWNVYRDYEDRFLDLFRRKKEDSN